MIKSVLLPIDGSPYTDSVLEYGIFMARRFNAVLRILTIVDIRLFDWSLSGGADSFVPIIPSPEFQEESQKLQHEKADQVLKKAGEILDNSGVKFESYKQAGIPVDEICNMARQADMVIMGIRGEYERWSDKLLGITAEAVTRQINKSVLLVDKEFKPIERIHVGYDGSDTANKALRLSAELSATLSLPLQVIAVFDSEDERNMVLDEAERYLLPYNLDYSLRHETGDVADVLVAAQKNAPSPALTVIGSYGHSRLREAILGSTTVEVMRKSSPVLLAK